MWMQTSRLKTVRTKFEWRIENFDKGSLLASNDSLVSSKFNAGGFQFELLLSDSLGISIRHNRRNYNLKAACGVLIYGDRRFSESNHQNALRPTVLSIGNNWLKIATIDPSKIENSSFLVIDCNVEFVLKDHGHPLHEDKSFARNTLRRMFESGICSDCRFKVGDAEINAHRSILALHSNVFRAMFQQPNTTEARTGNIIIEDSDFDSVMAMVEFLYLGSLAKAKEHLEGVLLLADKYAIKPLVDVCAELLGETIAISNFETAASLAEISSSESLLKACAYFLLRNRDEVIDSSEWNSLKSKNPNLAFRLIEISLKLDEEDYGSRRSSDTVEVPSDYVLFAPNR